MEVGKNDLTRLREWFVRIATGDRHRDVARDASPSALIRYGLVPLGPQRKSISQIFCSNTLSRFLFWICNKKNFPSNVFTGWEM